MVKDSRRVAESCWLCSSTADCCTRLSTTEEMHCRRDALLLIVEEAHCPKTCYMQKLQQTVMQLNGDAIVCIRTIVQNSYKQKKCSNLQQHHNEKKQIKDKL